MFFDSNNINSKVGFLLSRFFSQCQHSWTSCRDNSIQWLSETRPCRKSSTFHCIIPSSFGHSYWWPANTTWTHIACESGNDDDTYSASTHNNNNIILSGYGSVTLEWSFLFLFIESSRASLSIAKSIVEAVKSGIKENENFHSSYRLHFSFSFSFFILTASTRLPFLFSYVVCTRTLHFILLMWMCEWKQWKRKERQKKERGNLSKGIISIQFIHILIWQGCLDMEKIEWNSHFTCFSPGCSLFCCSM